MGVVPDMIELDPVLEGEAALDELRTALGVNSSCPYDMVVVGGADAVEDVLQVLVECPDTMVGSFDESTAIWAGVADGSLAFGVSQQQFLQGVMPVLLATSFATTGRVPAIPSGNPYGLYLSGPNIVNSDNVPSTEEQACIMRPPFLLKLLLLFRVLSRALKTTTRFSTMVMTTTTTRG